MKKIIKKFLLFVLIFVTFTGGAFASLRLPTSWSPEGKLLEEIKGAIRFMAVYKGTNEKIEERNGARKLIEKALETKDYHDYVILAFDDLDIDGIESYKMYKAKGDHMMKIVSAKLIIGIRSVKYEFIGKL